jgi:hypothetical protein
LTQETGTPVPVSFFVHRHPWTKFSKAIARPLIVSPPRKFLKQFTRLPGYQGETMKTLATKTNPAFKLAQPLPFWGGERMAVGHQPADQPQLMSSARSTPQGAISLAACALVAAHQLNTRTVRLMS